MKKERRTDFFVGNGADMLRSTAGFCLCALLGLAVPLMVAIIFDHVIPQAATFLLGQGLAVLVAAGIVRALLELTARRSLLRVGTRTAERVEKSTWQRLPALPMRFFRQEPAGEIGARFQAAGEGVRLWFGAGQALLPAGSMAVANLGLMAWIHPFLALLGLGLMAVAVCGATLFRRRRRDFLFREYEEQGRSEARAFEWIRGLGKLRLAGAEEAVLGVWRKESWSRSQWSRRAGYLEIATEAIFAGVTALGCAVLFAAASRTELSPGHFLAFLAAFGALAGAVRAIASAWPLRTEASAREEQARPVFETPLESAGEQRDPGVLTGAIEMSDVWFRYSADSPWVLEGFSLSVKPGEFVALAGVSGCGKSTVLRLILGFIQPERGEIRFDGRPLAVLDPGAVRAQMGVVLQNPPLSAGDIFQNIAGAAELSLDDAWHAAGLAGLADEILSLPMQMHTIVSEGGANFSTGQRQRMALARALARSPRILLLDEPTASLENFAQTSILESLDGLVASRILVTHRPEVLARAGRVVTLPGKRR